VNDALRIDLSHETVCHIRGDNLGHIPSQEMGSRTMQEECDNIVKELKKVGAENPGCFNPKDGKRLNSAEHSVEGDTYGAHTYIPGDFYRTVHSFYQRDEHSGDDSIFEELRGRFLPRYIGYSIVIDREDGRQVCLWFFERVVIIAEAKDLFSDMNKCVRKTIAGSSNFCFGRRYG